MAADNTAIATNGYAGGGIGLGTVLIIVLLFWLLTGGRGFYY